MRSQLRNRLATTGRYLKLAAIMLAGPLRELPWIRRRLPTPTATATCPDCWVGTGEPHEPSCPQVPYQWFLDNIANRHDSYTPPPVYRGGHRQADGQETEREQETTP